MRVPLIIIILIKSNYNSNYSNNKVIIIIIIITNNYNNNKSEEDLCTTVSIVLSANSGTFSPVFVKSLLLNYICRDGIYPLKIKRLREFEFLASIQGPWRIRNWTIYPMCDATGNNRIRF